MSSHTHRSRDPTTVVSARCVECKNVREKRTYTDLERTRSFKHVCHSCQTVTWWNAIRVLDEEISVDAGDRK